MGLFLKSLTYNICINIYTTENPFIAYYCLPNLIFSDTSKYRVILNRHLVVYLPQLIFKQERSLDFDISKKASVLYVNNSWEFMILFSRIQLQLKIFFFFFFKQV